MPQNPPKLCQEPTCPYAYPVGVMEDRSVLMGVPDGINGPIGSQETIVVKHTPPRNASNPPKLCQEPTRPYGSLVGVVEDRSINYQLLINKSINIFSTSNISNLFVFISYKIKAR